ncbi:hypothetical protein LJK88_19990 [Paenibacillus sp. P26]|nr:hypothetical protein LJK88_19990 [Paenibacillus sp. P26]
MRIIRSRPETKGRRSLLVTVHPSVNMPGNGKRRRKSRCMSCRTTAAGR